MLKPWKPDAAVTMYKKQTSWEGLKASKWFTDLLMIYQYDQHVCNKHLIISGVLIHMGNYIFIGLVFQPGSCHCICHS